MVNEEPVEKVTGPFDAVLDLVGEVPQSAHGNGLFWGILGVSIALSDVGYNHL